jgi:Holliday junction resolvase RusA-like endonuclease
VTTRHAPTLTIPTARALTIRAFGQPATQGSKDFKGMRNRRPVLVEADPLLPEWRKTVIAAARNAALAAGWLMLNEPVEVWITMYLPRPKTVTREYPEGRGDGDVDKYARGILDALSLAGTYYDDSRVIDCHCSKRYADPGQPTGAWIRVASMSKQGALV